MNNHKGDASHESNLFDDDDLEDLEDMEEQVEWDGSEAELVPDEDAEEFEDNFAGIKISYVLKEEEIYDALRASKSYQRAKKRLIVESIIACIMAGVFFVMFGIESTSIYSVGVNWLTLSFAVICLILSVIIWPSARYSLHKNAKRLANNEEIQMEIYPALIEMGRDMDKWVIPLDGTVACKKTNHLFVLQTDKSHITILPLRCIEPSVLPDVEAIILSGTNQVQ